jgi:pimeloyl-ACP methyl ester carboxylesterase
MRPSGPAVQRDKESVKVPIWQELLVGVEMVYLRLSPVYWGFGIPKGNGSAVVVIPGFLGTDLYLTEFRSWLRRIGYQPFDSGIGFNAECPNLLIRQRLAETVIKAHRATRRKVHLVGHSLGGIMARAIGAQMPQRVASVITLGAPFGGVACHPSVMRVSEMVRQQILKRHGDGVLPGCYTSACTCNFVESVLTDLPKKVRQTAVYSKTDSIVDWQACRTGNPEHDFEVSATHLGLVFSPLVYSLVAHRLAGKRPQ